MMIEQVHRVASKTFKENKLYQEQLRKLGCSVSEYNSEVNIIKIYKIVKAIDTVIDIPTLAVVWLKLVECQTHKELFIQ